MNTIRQVTHQISHYLKSGHLTAEQAEFMLLGVHLVAEQHQGRGAPSACYVAGCIAKLTANKPAAVKVAA